MASASLQEKAKGLRFGVVSVTGQRRPATERLIAERGWGGVDAEIIGGVGR